MVATRAMYSRSRWHRTDLCAFAPNVWVIATDPDVSMLECAKGRASQARATIVLVAADAEALPLRDAAFDEGVGGLPMCSRRVAVVDRGAQNAQRTQVSHRRPAPASLRAASRASQPSCYRDDRSAVSLPTSVTAPASLGNRRRTSPSFPLLPRQAAAFAQRSE